MEVGSGAGRLDGECAGRPARSRVQGHRPPAVATVRRRYLSASLRAAWKSRHPELLGRRDLEEERPAPVLRRVVAPRDDLAPADGLPSRSVVVTSSPSGMGSLVDSKGGRRRALRLAGS